MFVGSLLDRSIFIKVIIHSCFIFINKNNRMQFGAVYCYMINVNKHIFGMNLVSIIYDSYNLKERSRRKIVLEITWIKQLFTTRIWVETYLRTFIVWTVQNRFRWDDIFGRSINNWQLGGKFLYIQNSRFPTLSLFSQMQRD